MCSIPWIFALSATLPVSGWNHIKSRIPFPLPDGVFCHGILIVGLGGPMKITYVPLVPDESMYAAIRNSYEKWNIFQLFQQPFSVVVRHGISVPCNHCIATDTLR